MKKLSTKRIVALGVGAAAGAAIIGAPVAKAETLSETVFLSHITTFMGGTSRQALINDGWSVCGALTSGISSGTVAREVFLNSNRINGWANGVWMWQAELFVAYANQDLCPTTIAL